MNNNYNSSPNNKGQQPTNKVNQSRAQPVINRNINPGGVNRHGFTPVQYQRPNVQPTANAKRSAYQNQPHNNVNNARYPNSTYNNPYKPSHTPSQPVQNYNYYNQSFNNPAANNATNNHQSNDEDPLTQTISNHPISGYSNINNTEPPDIRLYDKRKNFRVQPAEKPKKKIFKKLAGLFITLILIATILLSAVFVGIYSLCAKTNYIPDELNPEEGFFEMFFSNESVYNVLLIGTDAENDDISRSDTMMLVTIDKLNEKIKLTSFMRDTWVSIPGYGEGRLNASYAKGGPELLIKTINTNFKTEIHKYILIDFKMFVELIDELGGVEVEVTEKEAEFINRTTSVSVESGLNNLNGEEALVYCRIRKLDSDFMRTQRQRKVITAIVNKAKSQDILTVFEAGTSVLPLIQTNIAPTEMTAKSLTIVSALDYSVEQMRIPVDNGFKEERINEQQVLVPDLKLNSDEIDKFINE